MQLILFVTADKDMKVKMIRQKNEESMRLKNNLKNIGLTRNRTLTFAMTA